MVLAALAKRRDIESYVVTAIPMEGRLYVAFNIIDGDESFIGSAVIVVDLATFGASLAYASKEPMIDYVVAQDGWQCLLMATRIVEIAPAGKHVETLKKLPEGLYRMSSLGERRVAICGDRGQAFIYAKKKLTKIAVDTGADDPAYAEDLASIHFAAPDRGYAVGSYGVFLKGDAKKLAPAWKKTNPFDVPRGRAKVLAVYETSSGAVALGSREGPAVLYEKGKFMPLTGLPRDASVFAMAELRGQEYWSTSDNALYVRKGTKLRKLRAQAGGYRMETDDQLLASSCGSFVYLFDGKQWTRLRINPDPKKLVERLKLDFKP